MTIGVIAANGRTGKEVVNAAVARGHRVRAGVYGAYDLDIHQNVAIITCDATNKDNLRELLLGCEAVISVIGHERGSGPTVQTKATLAVIDVMEELGISRFVSLTSSAVRFPGDEIQLFDRLLTKKAWLINTERIKDSITHVDVIKKSKLDWTIVRVAKLTNGKFRNYKLLLNGPGMPFVPRKTAAAALIDLVNQKSFIGEAPVIGRA